MCPALDGEDGPEHSKRSPAASEFALTWDAHSSGDKEPVSAQSSTSRSFSNSSHQSADIAGKRLGDFRLLRVIGRGGMGVVYEAEQISLNRPVAVKVLAPHAGISRSIVLRFQREAEAGGRQHHPGIVAIHAIGEQDGVYYIAQELIEGGRTLADQLDEARAADILPHGYFRQIARRFLEIAAALQNAHESGVIHRDIKPSNILLARNGNVKIGDFGLAKIENAHTLSRTGLFEGTPYYVSPEQVAGRCCTIDRRTDIYSLGVTLYEALTLLRPFTGDSSAEVLHRVLHTEPVDPRRVNPRIPRDLAVICQKAMEREPAARYATMADLGADLSCWLAGEAIAARPPGAATRMLKWARRRRPLMAALAGAVLVGSISGLLFFIRHTQNVRAFRALAVEAEAAAHNNAWSEAIEKAVRAISLQPRDPTMRDRHQLYIHQKELFAVKAERDEKEQALRRLEGQHLVSVSAKQLEHNPGLALLLALAGSRRNPSIGARNAVAEALLRNREIRTLVFRPYPFLPELQAAEIQPHSFLVLSPDGRRILTSAFDDAPRIWDASSGKEIFVLRAFDAASQRYRRTAPGFFSPDGRLAALPTIPHGGLVWDVATGEQTATLESMDSVAGHLSFSPDSRQIAMATWLGPVYVFDAQTGEQLRVLRGHRSRAVRVRFSPDGRRIVSASSDSTARVWDARTGALVSVLSGHNDVVRTARFSPDGSTVVSASDDLTLRFWNPESGLMKHVIRSVGSPVIAVYEIVYSPDGSLITTTWGESILRVWRATTGQEILQLHGHQGIVRAVNFSPDGTRIVTAAFDNTARIWDAETGQELAVLRGHTGALHQVLFSLDGQMVYTIAEDATVRFWNGVTAPRRDTCLTGRFSELAFAPGDVIAPDGLWELTGDRLPSILILRPRHRQSARPLRLQHEDDVTGGRFSPSGRLFATATRDDEIGIAKIWETATGQLKGTVRTKGGILIGCVFLDDQRLITASADGTVRLWNWEGQHEFLNYTGHTGWVFTLCYNDDGTRLVTAASDGTARVWDATSGKVLTVLRGHEDSVSTAVFSPDASHVATTSRDRTVRLWDAGSGEELLTIKIPAEDYGGIAGFSPDGTQIVYRAPNSTTQSCPVDILTTAERQRPRDLTPAEKVRYGAWDPGEEEAYALVQRLFDELILVPAVIARIMEDPSLHDEVRRAALHFVALHEDSEEMLRLTAATILADPASDSVTRARAQRMVEAAMALAVWREQGSP